MDTATLLDFANTLYTASAGCLLNRWVITGVVSYIILNRVARII